MLSTPQTLQRKKSLPEVSGPLPPPAMSREEVSALGSARREEVRRMHEETEKLRANPLLYLVSPQVKVTIHTTTPYVISAYHIPLSTLKTI